MISHRRNLQLHSHSRIAIALVAIVMALTTFRTAAADKQLRPKLDEFLKRLGYESIILKRDPEQNHLLVEGELNERKRTFLVDTGWSFTAVGKAAARDLKTLGELDVKLKDSFLGMVDRSSLVLLEKLKLGQAEFYNQPARVRSVSVPGVQSEYHGVLGADFLFRNFCLIDCLDRRLYVRAKELSVEARKVLEESLRISGAHPVALEYKPGAAMACKARVNNQPVKLLVDTGAIWSVLDEDEAKRLKLATRSTGSRIMGVKGIGGTWLQLAELKSFDLGTVQLRNVFFGVAETDRWGITDAKSAMPDVVGLLGSELLVLNGALIDCRGAKLWLNPVVKTTK